MPDSNPLLQNWDLPPWSSVRAEHLVPAITSILASNRQVISDIVVSQAETPNWDDLVLAVDEIDARLADAISIIDVLTVVKNHDNDWQSAVTACSTSVEEYRAWKMAHRELFNAYQNLEQSSIARSFDAPRQAALAKILREFQLSGIELPVEGQQELTELNGRIRQLEEQFLNNLENDSARWHKPIDDITLLGGLPAALQQRFAQLAEAAGHGGWLIPLDLNTHQQIMMYAHNRALREEHFLAYFTRASDQGPHSGQYNNAPVLETLLALRHRKARLLGFANFAELIQASVSDGSTAQVKAFIEQHIAASKPARISDTDAVKAFAVERGILEVQGWDQEYLVEQLREHHFGDALKELRSYLPLDGTLRRLCLFSERMFGVEIVELREFERWHEHLRLFEVRENGQTLGYLYLDPFKVNKSLDFASTFTLRNRRITAEGRPVLPIALMSCNFTLPAEDQPCLLEHLDLRVLFHEFGHCLQHILTRSPHHVLSGITQLPRPTAEFAGQLFEGWCQSREFLLWLGAHHATGERLSETRVDAVLAALQTQASRQTAIQLTLALLDFELHATHGDGRNVEQVFQDVQKEIPQLKLPGTARLANGFDYVVTGYEAMVYAYLWSGVLATEVFKRFEQDWVFNPKTGREFREIFFSPGDAQSLLSKVQAFLGHPADALFARPTPTETNRSVEID
ncbi:oligopeptidase A [Pseudomonas fluorescens]|uniref:Oligopeptidase A n=1 Tax=Pseudomonas fluorescens TaxID=294 RepID=A0A3S4PMX2_PSEFL|nr:M3 family metallopeptidase [Pseudomonas fluorescens]VEF06474.1 oligopeptidase A [Pseudomonas fluorescens]